MKTYSIAFVIIAALIMPSSSFAKTAPSEKSYTAKPAYHVYKMSVKAPEGLTPGQIKEAYNIPHTAIATGTIAIVTAFSSDTLSDDLDVFSKSFSLPLCNQRNGCLETYTFNSKALPRPANWQVEVSLDAEWTHAIAPTAHILVIEAAGQKTPELLKAIDYARSRPDVVAVSMSWGGPEFSTEGSLDSHFTSDHVTFFAASGDSGNGVNWPAVSKNVVAVGGSSLRLMGTTIISEKAWIGSGGGISTYEKQPEYQKNYDIPKANGMRAIPDVAYNADPSYGFAVYKSNSNGGHWYVVGGTSAGAPQWAAIKALNTNANNISFYSDKAKDPSYYFKDIITGSNGNCTYYCDAHRHYDYVTGLGSPRTINF